jgi:hypothetical protein
LGLRLGMSPWPGRAVGPRVWKLTGWSSAGCSPEEVGRRQLARSAGGCWRADSLLAGARAQGRGAASQPRLTRPGRRSRMNHAPSAARRRLWAGGGAAPLPDPARCGRWRGEHRQRTVPAGVGRPAGDDPHPGRAGRPHARQAGGGPGRAGQPGRRGPAAAHPQEPRAAQPPDPARGQTPARRGRDRYPRRGGAAAAACPRPGAGGPAVRPPGRRGQATGRLPRRRVVEVVDADPDHTRGLKVVGASPGTARRGRGATAPTDTGNGDTATGTSTGSDDTGTGSGG